MSGAIRDAASLQVAARVVEKTRENALTVMLTLDAALECAPGQFAMIWLPGVDEKPFSIAGADPLSFAVSQVGPFSDALCALKPEDRVWVRGPFGTGFSASSGRALLVGGGYGAAPLAFLARTLLACGATVDAALGARGVDDLLFVNRFRDLGATVHLATEDGSAGAHGRVTDVVGPLLRAGGIDRLYACGPEAMLDALAALCDETTTPAELSYEAYMRCGIGICGSCEHGERLVCRDGPVFTLSSGHGSPA
jgi:dihydroorotate dehydrogenase electron transfer subunit